MERNPNINLWICYQCQLQRVVGKVAFFSSIQNIIHSNGHEYAT